MSSNVSTQKAPRISLSRRAKDILFSRSPESTQRSLLTNSLLIRYDAIVKENYRSIEIKFDPDERLEFVHQLSLHINSRATSDGKALWMFDQGDDLQQFSKIIRNAISNGSLMYLSNGAAENLVDVLERHTNTTEFLTLCDWIANQLQVDNKLQVNRCGVG